ncbi:hypothetical protein BZY94_40930 [Burkholderia territorii]|nr:hypothetical protein BZY94_40930 [Burkholderia territorii]
MPNRRPRATLPSVRAYRPNSTDGVGVTDLNVVNAALQSYGVGVPVTVASFALDVTFRSTF